MNLGPPTGVQGSMAKPKRHRREKAKAEALPPERARSPHSGRESAVLIEHGGRRYLVLTHRGALFHARELLADGALAETIDEDDFERLADAFPWDA